MGSLFYFFSPWKSFVIDKFKLFREVSTGKDDGKDIQEGSWKMDGPMPCVLQWRRYYSQIPSQI